MIGSARYHLASICLLIFAMSGFFGVLTNGVYITAPTTLRYVLVFGFVAVVHQKASPRISGSQLSRLVSKLVAVLSVFALIQILTGNLAYKTGTFRLSSVYGDNVTGFSLFVTTAFLYLYHRANLVFSAKHVGYAAICFLMVLGSQSRLAVGSCLLLTIAYHVLKLRVSLKSIVITTVGLVTVCFLGYLVVFYFELAPRLVDTFRYNFQDASTQSRVAAWITVLQYSSVQEIVLGIGPGAFHHRYNMLTGIVGMDAHFDFVKIFVENGVVVWTVYLLVLLAFFSILMSRVIRTKSGDDSLAAILFVNVFFLSSLHNAYFYFESMVLGCLIIGVVSTSRVGQTNFSGVAREVH